MNNKNRKLRAIVIGTETWKWYVSDKGVVIFTPAKVRHAVSVQKLLLDTTVNTSQQWDVWDGDNISVTPARVKKYICNVILEPPTKPKIWNNKMPHFGKATDLVLKMRALLKSYNISMQSYSYEQDLKLVDAEGNKYCISLSESGMPYINAGFNKDWILLK